MMVTDVLGILISAGIGVAVFLAVYCLLNFIEKRRRMKIQLLRQRDAMVADLMRRMMQDKAALRRKAFDARREMIRVSFDIGRNELPRSKTAGYLKEIYSQQAAGNYTLRD